MWEFVCFILRWPSSGIVINYSAWCKSWGPLGQSCFAWLPYISCRHRKNISLTPRRIFSGGNWAKLGRLFPGWNSKRDESELGLRGGQEVTLRVAMSVWWAGGHQDPVRRLGGQRPAAGVRGIRSASLSEAEGPLWGMRGSAGVDSDLRKGAV